MFIKKRERTDNFYQELQEKTLERLQELSGDIWTDFNVHDPGVTISDNMNYALFELQYKLELPFRAFVGPHPEEYAGKGILPAEQILSPSIVTPADYEQLFLSDPRLKPYMEDCVVDFDRGFYRIRAYVSLEAISKAIELKSTLNSNLEEEQAWENEQKNIKEFIFELFHANRNLCEDLRWADIQVLSKSGKLKKKPEYHEPVETAYKLEQEKVPVKIRDYHSFQLDFPDVYGIGERGLPPEASERNEAHVMQLKGYLLMMDFLMANVTEQVQNSPQLLSFTETPPTGKVSLVSIPGVEKMINWEKIKRENKDQLQTTASILSKKLGFIDILDTLYGEDTDRFFQDFQPPKQKLAYRSTLTQELPELNRNRFRSFNKLKPAESNIIFKELFSLLHGKKVESEVPIRDLLGKFELDLLSDSVFFEQYEVYLDIAPISGVFYNPIFNETPQHIPVHEMDWKEEYFPSLQEEISLIRRNALFESLPEVGDDPENYRMIRLSENGRWILVFRYPGKKDWMILGSYRTKDHLIRSANRFWAFMRFLNPERHLFYLVEHRLLQFTHPKKRDEEEGYTLSIIASNRSEKKNEYDQLVHLLKERLPAHLSIRLYQMEQDRIQDFEQIYYRWREALASGNIRKLIHFSESIRAFFTVSKPYQIIQ
ncbi:hypothetical protein D3C87_196460 [compost metagenome]